jgi:hypothetical protein
MIEKDNANEKCDVFKICRTVRADVREQLDRDLTLEYAREALENVYNDLELVTIYSVRCKRKRHYGKRKERKKKRQNSIMHNVETVNIGS